MPSEPAGSRPHAAHGLCLIPAAFPAGSGQEAREETVLSSCLATKLGASTRPYHLPVTLKWHFHGRPLGQRGHSLGKGQEVMLLFV